MKSVTILLLTGWAAGLTCTPGSWNANGVCMKCHPSCASCSSALSCESCQECYQRPPALQAGLCMKTLCPLHCDTCTSGSCSSCSEGFGLVELLCKPLACGKYCDRCKDQSTFCTACAAPYHWQNANPGPCTDACPLHCTSCSTALKCLKCDSNFSLAQDQCSCIPGAHCVKCSEATCSLCEEGWKTTDSSLDCTCSPGTNCLSCTAEGCSKCSDGWRVVTGTMNCEEDVPVCEAFCLKCTAAECSKCADHYELAEGKCLKLCDDGFYRSTGSTCEACPTQCKTCLDKTRCGVCSYNFYSLELPGTCQACDKSCDGCNSAEKCLRCAASFFPVSEMPGLCTQTCSTSCKTCSVSSLKCDSCESGFFKTSDGPAECQTCAKSCQECSVSTSICTKCAANYAPSANLPGSCTVICDSSCKTCLSFATNCQICAEGLMPQSTTPGPCTQNCDASCAKCVENSVKCSSCATNYKPESVLPGLCLSKCDKSCNDCSATTRDCINCAAGYRKFSKASTLCVAEVLCHASCQQCVDTYTSCTQCADGFTLKGDFCMAESCFTGCSTCIGKEYDECISCADGYTLQADKTICQYNSSCTGACATCFGLAQNQCLTCKPHSAFRVQSTYCVCDMNYTLQGTECVYSGQCADTCKTCWEPSSTQCLTCPDNSSLADGKCVCDTGYVRSGSTCKYTGACAAICATCSGLVGCDSCVKNAHLQGGVCACDTDFTWNNACEYTGVCEAPCAKCMSRAVCSSCITPTTLTAGVCQCAADFTWQTNKCVYSGSCAEAYATCSGPTQGEGLTCDENARILGGVCSCNEKYSWDIEQGRCVHFDCYSTCVTCSGVSSSSCLSCNQTSNQALTSQHTCACAEGFYGTVTQASDVCQACDVTCQACSNSSTCTLCHEHASLLNKSCQCNDGYYWSDSACKQCPSACSRCSAPDSCSACTQNFVLVGVKCVCVKGWLLQGQECVACHPNCASCSGLSASECLSCASTQVLADGSCLCKISNEFNNSGICISCYDGCATCSGPKPSDCLSCYLEASLDTPPSSCICLDGKRPAPTPKKCSVCPEPCIDCLIADVSQCISCLENAQLANGNFPSFCECNTGFYFDSTSKICEKCHVSCKACSSASPLYCECIGFAYIDGLFCAPQCPFVAKDRTCQSPSGAFFHQPFNSVNSPVGLVQKWPSQLGGSPYVVFHQGLQLSGSQFVLLPPNSLESRNLLLPSSFILNFWVRTSNPQGCLLAKSISDTLILSLCIEQSLTLRLLLLSSVNIAIPQKAQLYESDMAFEVSVSGATIAATWTKVQVSVSTKSTGSQKYSVQVQLFVQDKLITEDNFSDRFFRDFPDGELLLGAGSRVAPVKGFVGAIGEVLFRVGDVPPAGCSCTLCAISGMCLSPCLATQYEDSGTCSSCSAQCSKGCERGEDCVTSRDLLCAAASDFEVCTSCKPLSSLKQGNCQCVPNSTFVTSTCVCVEGFKVSNNDCVPCLNYLKTSDVTGSIDASCTTIQLALQRALQTTALKSCADIFQEDSLAMLGTNPICVVRSTSIRVTLGNNFSLREADLLLKSASITAADGPCNFSPEPLVVHIKVQNPQPPVAVIAAPGMFSLACNSMLTISGANSKSGVQGQLLYKWDLSTSEKGALTMSYSSFSADNVLVTLSASDLIAAVLHVTLTVRNSFGSESSAQQNITLSDAPELSVNIDGGNTARLTSSSSQRFRGRVVGCKAGAIQYMWTNLAAANATGLSTMLARQTQGMLTIAAHALMPGNYTFLCTATDAAGKTGSALLQVEVLGSPLVIGCDKSGGLLSANQQLLVNCNATVDPDSPTSPVAAEWTCSTSAGTNLNFVKDKLTLIVAENQFVSGQQYVFILKATQGSKSNSLSLIFQISPVNGVEVSNSLKPGERFSNQHTAVVTPVIKAITGVTVSWGDAGSEGLPFLLIPASMLSTGGTLTIQLTLTLGSAKVSVQMDITVNNPPVGGSFTLSPTSGTALKTVFELRVSGCVEPDGTDYPITMSFGFGNGQLLGLPATSSSLTTRLSTDARSLFVKVCDSGDSCSVLYATADVQSKRSLLEDDFLALFKEMTPEPDMVPTACVLIAGSVKLNSTTWTYIMNAVLDHTTALPPLSENELLAELYCVQALAAQTTATLNPLLKALRTLNALLQTAVTDTVHIRQVEALRDYAAANETEIVNLLDYYQSIARQYTTTLLPKQEPFQYSSSQLSIFGGRVLASPAAVFRGPGFSVSMPNTFLADHSLTTSSILNVWVHCWRSQLFPTAMMSVSILKSGTFSQLSWISETPQELDSTELLFNVSIPMVNSSQLRGKTGCICWNSGWSIKECSVLSMSNDSVVVSTSCLGYFSLVPVQLGILQVDPLTEVPFVPSFTCDHYYAPVGIMAGLTGFLLAVGLMIMLTSKTKEKEFRSSDSANVPMEGFKPPEMMFSNEPDIIMESGPAEQLQDNEPIFSADNPGAHNMFKPAPLESKLELQEHKFWEGHFLLGTVFKHKIDNVLCLVTALLSELFFIGVFYYYLEPGNSEEQPMKSFFTDYGGDDVKYFVWAFLLTQVISLIMTVLFNPVWTTSDKWRKVSYYTGVAAGVAACVVFIVLIAIMNTGVCYEYAGRWSVGFLWNFIAEMLILEFLVAGFCSLLYHFARR